MRILTIGSLYPPQHLGGYELVWQSAVRHLRSRGHAVRVLTTDQRFDGAEGEEDPDVHRELRWYWHDHEFPRLSVRERLAIERHNARVFDGHLAESRPELISFWAMGGMSLSLIERARRAGIPTNAFVCDDWMTYAPKVDAWIRGFSRRPIAARVAELALRLPTRPQLERIGPVLFPSEATRRRALEVLPLTDTEVTNQGPDIEHFRELPAQPWRWRLLYAGRIDPRKGIELAVRTLGELPGEAVLTIAGAGDEDHKRELERLAAELGVADRVEFTVRSRGELPALYGDADALIFPVLWEEPWGLVPLEAMACGTPVAASGRGGSGEYLSDGQNCVLFEPDDGPSALAAALCRLAGDESLRERLRAGGLETAGRLSEAAWNRAVERLCERAAAAPTRAGSPR